MRVAISFLAVSLALIPACKKAGGGAEVVTKMTEVKDKMCACKDKACVDQVSADMTKWSTEHAGGEGSKVNADDQKKLAAITDEMTRCMSKVMVDAAGSAAGSAGSAGSGDGSAMAGSAAGSGNGSAMTGSGGGAGMAADGTPMAHRAGMCPSTVLGATTTSAAKGKTVVVTVESTDADAIAAIQKRADELLAEKAEPSTAAGGHDMKGTHGGGQGLCPVYVPDGAKATAKHEAKGVVVTITPKDKPDALAKEIAGRVTKAAEWVKTNVKMGDQQNQGGVGGGKGEDGSNHSGKGDGKGHERKGGGGKGTGGGGAAGTGGGSAAGSGKAAAGGGW
jgi:hypothetical protein